MRRSLADIIVATPGRLVDHINKKSGLNLDQLRFLVSIKTSVSTVHELPLQPPPVIQIIDEADRMIDSMHQAWLSQVVKATYSTGSGSIFSRSEPACVTAARSVHLVLYSCVSAAAAFV